MTLADWLVLAGGALQMAGIVVTGAGAVRTWNQFSPDERILDGFLGPLRSTAHSLYVRYMALIGRPIPARMSSTNAGPTFRIDGNGRLAPMNWRPLDIERDLKDLIEELDSRTRAITDDVNRVRTQFIDAFREMKGDLSSIESHLTTQADRLENQDRAIATGGIKAILIGLGLVGVGIFTQSIVVLID